MGTTYDAIFSNSGVAIQTTAVIEGFNYILTDGDPLLAFNATYYLNIRNWDAASQQPTAGGTIGVDVIMP